MFDYHADKQRYFEMQYLTARDFIIPFIKQLRSFKSEDRILEIGCAEAGVLKAFVEEHLFCFGIDLSPSRIETAKQFQQEAFDLGKIKFLSKNVYDIELLKDLGGPFDIIVLKDVIEHIPNQERFIPVLKQFLKPDGLIFFGFPPWQMPFGGHQQMSSSRILSKLPWYHLLPKSIYKFILKSGGQDPATLTELLEIKETGISIERFESIITQNNLKIEQRILFLTNPIYKFKFNLEPRQVPWLLAKIPILRNFYTTAAYYVIKER
ncbi:MAG: methyltransferase domain-containing protein [Saprospiraceae bacterium]|nr:methyltransferase domain-containing protein [Saprospiraceae bacterium]